MSYSPQLLSEADIQAKLQHFPLWEIREQCLYRNFDFKDFHDAWAFMQAVAKAAEALNHHPDWQNVYNKVEIKLSTHDAGGITALDFALAEAIDAC